MVARTGKVVVRSAGTEGSDGFEDQLVFEIGQAEVEVRNELYVGEGHEDAEYGGEDDGWREERKEVNAGSSDSHDFVIDAEPSETQESGDKGSHRNREDKNRREEASEKFDYVAQCNTLVHNEINDVKEISDKESKGEKDKAENGRRRHLAKNISVEDFHR